MKPVFIIAAITAAMGCSKSGNKYGESTGGFSPVYSRVFYKTKDFGGGPVAIEVTSQDGSKFIHGYLRSSYPK